MSIKECFKKLFRTPKVCKHQNPNNECNIFDSYEKLSPIDKLNLSVDLFKYKWGAWTLKTLGSSLLLIFIMSIIATLINFEFKIENTQNVLRIQGLIKLFEVLQVWVSFGLGIIAMLFSIISMFLSFYNLEQQKASEEKNFEYLKDLKTNIVNETKDETKKELNKILDYMKERFEILQNIAEETKENVQNSTVTEVKKLSDSEKENITGSIYEE